jgi:hypothetical protein
MKMRVVRTALRVMSVGALGTLGLFGGCGSDTSTGGGPDAGGAVTGSYSHYVNASLSVGNSASDALALAFDLDNDSAHKKDNELGSLLAGLKSTGYLDVNASIKTAVDAGDFVILHSVQATSLSASSSASWQVYIGDPLKNPDLTSGNGKFTIASSSPTNAKLAGSITGGLFSGGPGNVTLQLSVVPGQPAITIPLVSAHLEAQVSATGCMSGRLGGGIKKTDIDGVVIPALAAGLNARINADGNCKNDYNSCNSQNKSILDFLDRMGTGNMDNQIQASEISTNPLIAGALKADVDLLDASGNLGHDGVAESASIAVGFTCTKATFTAASEG